MWYIQSRDASRPIARAEKHLLNYNNKYYPALFDRGPSSTVSFKFQCVPLIWCFLFSFSFLFTGYNYIFTIPVGSTDIVIIQYGWKNREDSNYLGQFLLLLQINIGCINSKPTFKKSGNLGRVCARDQLWDRHLFSTSFV